MVRFRLYFNKDKETAYLNEMVGKGYAMKNFFAGFYLFERCRPGEYIYQVDIGEAMFQVSGDYREFMQDMGVEIVCTWGLWVLLRKKAAEGPFVLYTDVESNIRHYERIRRMFKTAAILEIIFAAVNLFGVIAGGSTTTAALPAFFCFLLTALAVCFVREIARVDGILEELRGRIGKEQPKECWRGGRRPSLFLAVGLLVNGITYLMPAVEESNRMEFPYGFVKGCLQGVALVFFVIGIVNTMRSGR